MNKIVSEVMLTLFLMVMLASAFNVKLVVHALTEGVYRVDMSVLTMEWAYPGEEVTVQLITMLDKYKPPAPGEPPGPWSPGDWVFIGNVSLTFEVRDEAGNPVDVKIPDDLRTDDTGHLEFTFEAPEKEGDYVVIVYAVIEGTECQDSETLKVSSEIRPSPGPTPAPGATPEPVPTPAPTSTPEPKPAPGLAYPPWWIVSIAIVAVILVAVALWLRRNRVLFVIVAVLIIVGFMVGVYYYSTLPVPSPTTTPPLPTPMPSKMPTPFLPSIEVEVVSLEGFIEMGDASPEKVLVLHQGNSASITLNVYSHYDESCNVSFSLEFVGWESVNYRFYPSTLELPPEGVATSILTLEADSDAPSNLIYDSSTLLCRRFEGFEGASGKYLGFSILVFPITPSYIFSVYAEESPTPTPWTPPPWEPEIQIERGGEAQIIFCILTEIENPSLKLSLSYQSGELPEGINANITPDPLTIRSLLLTLTANPQTPEVTYEITANGSVDSITFERKFHLKVTS